MYILSYIFNFFTLFHFLIIAAFVTQSPIIYGMWAVLALYIIFYNFHVKFYRFEQNSFLIFLGLISIITVINFLSEPIVIYHYLISIISFLTAIILIKYPRVYYYASKYSLIVFQSICLTYALYKGFGSFPAIIPFENMIEGSSANGITSKTVLLQVNFSIISFLLFRKVVFFTSVITLVVALMGYARGSIICSTLILIVSLFTSFALKGKLKFFSYLLLFLLIISLVVNHYYEQIHYFLKANTKLTAGLVDYSRESMRKDYLGKIDYVTFFTGADYEYTSIKSKYNNNPHNAFIRAHHIFGLPYLIFVIAFPFYAIFKQKGIIEIFFYTALLLILFFRIFSEPVILPTIFDFYFFSMFLLIANNKGNVSEKYHFV